MSDSSDEDLDSSNELIDLDPLWRDHPFLSSSSSEAEEELPLDSDEDEVTSPSVTGPPPPPPPPPPSPMTTSVLDMATLEASLAAINYNVAAARLARVRLLEGIVAGQSQRQNVAPPQYSIDNSTQQPQCDSSPRRNSPPRNISGISRPMLGRRHISPNRTGAGRTLTFSAETSTSNPEVNTPASTSADSDDGEVNITANRDPRFVLPGAIREREEAEERRLSDATRALRSEFVSELLMSSLTRRRSRADLQNLPNRFGTKGKDPKPEDH